MPGVQRVKSIKSVVSHPHPPPSTSKPSQPQPNCFKRVVRWKGWCVAANILYHAAAPSFLWLIPGIILAPLYPPACVPFFAIAGSQFVMLLVIKIGEHYNCKIIIKAKRTVSIFTAKHPYVTVALKVILIVAALAVWPGSMIAAGVIGGVAGILIAVTFGMRISALWQKKNLKQDKVSHAP